MLPIVLVILFALLDLGIAAVRYNALADASRRIAREAIIHGSLAPARDGNMGTGRICRHGGGRLATCQFRAGRSADDGRHTMVSVRVSWPDGDNSPRDRVEVEMNYQHEPLIPALFAWGTLDLRSTTTMRIVN